MFCIIQVDFTDVDMLVLICMYLYVYACYSDERKSSDCVYTKIAAEFPDARDGFYFYVWLMQIPLGIVPLTPLTPNTVQLQISGYHVDGLMHNRRHISNANALILTLLH